MFENCLLQYASFYRLKIKQTRFINCNAIETDFTEADATEVVFDNTNLALAIFEQTNLQKTDFRTAMNYQINPSNNIIKQAKFSWPELKGLLSELQIEIE